MLKQYFSKDNITMHLYTCQAGEVLFSWRIFWEGTVFQVLWHSLVEISEIKISCKKMRDSSSGFSYEMISGAPDKVCS